FPPRRSVNCSSLGFVTGLKALQTGASIWQGSDRLSSCRRPPDLPLALPEPATRDPQAVLRLAALGGESSAGIATAHPRTGLTEGVVPAQNLRTTESTLHQRFRMTTTTKSLAPPSTGIAWAPVVWIGGLHLLALLAFVPAYFSWSALAVCVV